jgi:hypothetical protein
MRWFRSNRYFGARLALIAVALQLVLTFGHVHLALKTAADQEMSWAAAGSGGSDPSDRNPSGLAELDCPLCALLHLSATTTPALAPALPPPIAAAFVTLTPHASTRLVASARISQQARAPPA